MNYGKGKIFFMALPLEQNVIQKSGTFTNVLEPYYEIYRTISEEVRGNRVITKDNPYIGVTEHTCDDRSKIAILINYSPENIDLSINLAAGWEIDKVLHGDAFVKDYEKYKFNITANSLMILSLRR